MHNYIDERNRKNRRSKTKIFDKNKNENFCETAIIAIENVFAIVNEKIEINAMIEITIKNFYNTISMFAKISNDDEIIDFLIEIFDER